MSQTAQRLLADIRELAPHVMSRAAEIEAGRRIPTDLVEALRSTGVFRMFVPQSHGGLELDQAKRMKDLERENVRLKRLVADLSLEKQVLKDVASGNL